MHASIKLLLVVMGHPKECVREETTLGTVIAKYVKAEPRRKRKKKRHHGSSGEQ